MSRQNLQERDILQNLSVIWRILKWTLIGLTTLGTGAANLQLYGFAILRHLRFEHTIHCTSAT
jgi:hypothetical protein